MALRAVYEDRNRQEIIANGKLTAREDRAAGNAELVIAGLALEQLAGCVGVDGGAFAARANWSTIGGSLADQPERLISFLVGKARDFRQTERPRLS